MRTRPFYWDPNLAGADEGFAALAGGSATFDPQTVESAPIAVAAGETEEAPSDGAPPSQPLEPPPPEPQLPQPELPEPSPAALEPEPEPEPAGPSPFHGAPAPDDPVGISYSRLLEERPDVLRAYYEAYHRDRDPHSSAWSDRVGGTTAEAYAKYWYAQHGRYEGYNQGPTTAGDNVSPERILQERPDVLRAFYEAYYGHNDRHSSAWAKRVGGDTPEAYAKYWYEKYGRWEGYAQSDKAAAENIDVERLLSERPDVFRAFFTEYYGDHNDRKSSAWADRVGGETVQDYAKYWYVTYGKAQGYTQHAAAPPAQGGSEGGSQGGSDGGAPATDEPGAPPPIEWRPDNDPSLDPWNHPAIFPDWRPPYEGWQPPGAPAPSAALAAEPATPAEAVAVVGQSFLQPDLLV